ncbi:MAG: hypothetical protein H8E15_02980 [Planctomycetes bacterium]|nr:hypothetical protein [Planctomycetota bacterium]
MNEKPLPLFESLASVFVVAIVAVFAALPALKNPSERGGHDAVLEDHLDQLRTAVVQYLDEESTMPTLAEEFEIALTSVFLTAIPENPINHRSSIRILNADSPRANGTAGWIFVPNTRNIYPDLPGEDGLGKSYLSY